MNKIKIKGKELTMEIARIDYSFDKRYMEATCEIEFSFDEPLKMLYNSYPIEYNVIKVKRKAIVESDFVGITTCNEYTLEPNIQLDGYELLNVDKEDLFKVLNDESMVIIEDYVIFNNSIFLREKRMQEDKEIIDELLDDEEEWWYLEDELDFGEDCEDDELDCDLLFELDALDFSDELLDEEWEEYK